MNFQLKQLKAPLHESVISVTEAGHAFELKRHITCQEFGEGGSSMTQFDNWTREMDLCIPP